MPSVENEDNREGVGRLRTEENVKWSPEGAGG